MKSPKGKMSSKSCKSSSRSGSISPSSSSRNFRKQLHLNDESKSVSNSRRSSSFTSTRRRSFLSTSMIHNENYLVYEISGYDFSFGSCRLHGINRTGGEKCTCPLIPRYSVSLNESQGFNWNQDLFANQAEQKQGILCYNDTFVDENEEDHDIIKPRTRVFSYSLSHDAGNMDKVDVFEVKLDDKDTLGF